MTLKAGLQYDATCAMQGVKWARVCRNTKPWVLFLGQLHSNLFYVNLPLDYYCTHSTISILTHVGLIDQRNGFSSHYRVHHN